MYRVYDHDDKYMYSILHKKEENTSSKKKKESELSQRETMPIPWEP